METPQQKFHEALLGDGFIKTDDKYTVQRPCGTFHAHIGDAFITMSLANDSKCAECATTYNDALALFTNNHIQFDAIMRIMMHKLYTTLSNE